METIIQKAHYTTCSVDEVTVIYIWKKL